MEIMTTTSVIIIAIIFITIIGFGAQGRSELYHILGKPTPQGTTGGTGDTMGWGGGEGGPSSAAPYIKAFGPKRPFFLRLLGYFDAQG